jgi:hypothetical protein
MLQLAAIANAWSARRRRAPSCASRSSGCAGDAAVWSLRFEGPQAVVTPEGTVTALRFLREGRQAARHARGVLARPGALLHAGQAPG